MPHNRMPDMILFSALLNFFSLTAPHAFAQVPQTILIRDEHFKPTLVSALLTDLTSPNRFEGLHFKIVKGRNEDAILVNDPDENLRLKAATTYYHLTRARNFWIDTLKSKYVQSLPQMTIRLEISNRFSDLGHFQHDSIDPQFNNALSIPDGIPMDGVNIQSWGHEIWFRPVKKILARDLPRSGFGPEGNPITQYLTALSETIYTSTANQILKSTLQRIFYPDTLTTPFETTVMRRLGTLALTAIALKGSRYADPLFLEKYYYLDTAMVPEIIYHEFSHVALSDHLSLSLSTPILEGMADYFATAISGNPEIASNIRLYALSMPKNGRNRTHYSRALEDNLFANSDFVLSVLWLLKDEFPLLADQIVFNASNYLSTESSNIRHDLIRSILSSCEIVCESPRLNKLQIRELLEEKGF